MSKPTNNEQFLSPIPVAVIAPTTTPVVQYVSEIGRLRKLREYYKQGKRESFERIRVQIENERCTAQNDVDQLKTLIDHNSTMLNLLQHQHDAMSTVLKEARNHVLELKTGIERESANEDIRKIEQAAQELLKKFESEE